MKIGGWETMRGLTVAGVMLVLVACGGGGGDTPTTNWCPSWELGDSASYIYSTSVDGVTTYEVRTVVVTAREESKVAVTDGETSRVYSVRPLEYRPLSMLVSYEKGASPNIDIGYISLGEAGIPVCPPPALGGVISHPSIIFDPDFGLTIMGQEFRVAAVNDETITVPAGDFSSRKVVLESSHGDQIILNYVPGLGVVKAVEPDYSTNAIIGRVLVAYDESAPALGTVDNPIVVTADALYQNARLVSYVAHVGTGSLYFKLTGLEINASHDITLTELTDNSDLFVYSDAGFSSELCRSMQAGSTDEICASVTSDGNGELYVKVDGSATSSGSDMALRVELNPAI